MFSVSLDINTFLLKVKCEFIGKENAKMHLLTFNQFIPSAVGFEAKYCEFGGQLKGTLH